MAKKKENQGQNNQLYAAFAFFVLVSALISGVTSGVVVFVWQNNTQQLDVVEKQLEISTCESQLEDTALRYEMLKTELEICRGTNET